MNLRPPLLEVSSITKTFGGVTALSEVSFAIEPGEIVAIIGENGAGKSTLAKVMSGVHSPDSGFVTVMDRDVNFATVQKPQNMGFPEYLRNSSFCDSMTVEENLLLGSRTFEVYGPVRFS